MKIKRICTIIGMISATSGFAQKSELLPPRVGAFLYAYRSFTPIHSSFGDTGQLQNLGNDFTTNFTGEHLLSGKAGADLKRLADEIKNFDSRGLNGGDNILDRLDLGTLRGNVTAKVNAQIFGLAFGATKNLSLFMGIPYIKADVKTRIELVGTNNAAQIKSELGDLAFDELKAGLDQADALSVEQIESSFADAGYKSLNHWSKKGFGDLRLGARTAKSINAGHGFWHNFLVSPSLQIPTGYVEQADILTDLNFGRGYYGLGTLLEDNMTFLKYYSWRLGGEYTYNLDTTAQKRLPEGDEPMVLEDRDTKVSLNPGDDLDLYTSLGVGNGTFGGAAKVGRKQHFSDSYSGGRAGNYSRLNRNTGSEQFYYEGIATFSTVPAFQKKRFVYPFNLEFIYHAPYAAKNSADERYFQLGFLGLFKI